MSPVRFLVAPQKRKAKQRKILVFNENRDFLFSPKTQKSAVHDRLWWSRRWSKRVGNIPCNPLKKAMWSKTRRERCPQCCFSDVIKCDTRSGLQRYKCCNWYLILFRDNATKSTLCSRPTNQHTNQPLFLGHNRPYDQHHSNRLIIEQKSKYYAVISRHWKFMFKQT